MSELVVTSQFELQLLDQLFLLGHEGGRRTWRPLRSWWSWRSWKTMLHRHTSGLLVNRPAGGSADLQWPRDVRQEDMKDRRQEV